MSSFGQSFGATTSSRPRMIATSDHACAQPGNDGISSLNWSPTANILVSSSWDNGVRCWEVQAQSPSSIAAAPKAQVNHLKPVLDTCFSPDGNTVFSCGADGAARMWQLGGAPPANNIAQQIGSHDAPIKCIGFIKSSNMVVTGGWDKKIKFWDCRQQQPVGQFDMPERVYAMDVQDNMLVVGTADRMIIAYDVSGTPREHTRKESPLKHQTRCIACFPEATGFAIGSIEGRVGIHYLQKVQGKESFAFKCHRDGSNVYAVNAIAFHRNYGTFATCGADGVINFWDKDNKQRLKGFSAIQRPISAAAFNAQGNLFAYASSYDWSKGSSGAQQGDEIFVHYVVDEEIRPKGKR